jgi:hypothetical protein
VAQNQDLNKIREAALGRTVQPDPALPTPTPSQPPYPISSGGASRNRKVVYSLAAVFFLAVVALLARSVFHSNDNPQSSSASTAAEKTAETAPSASETITPNVVSVDSPAQDCPVSADVDRRFTKGESTVAGEWIGQGVRVLLCSDSTNYFYFGETKAGTIYLDASITNSGLTAANGDTVYELSGSILYVRLPNKTVTFSVSRR